MNPYTNIAFGIANHYTIYLFMVQRYHWQSIPFIIHEFRKCGFSIHVLSTHSARHLYDTAAQVFIHEENPSEDHIYYTKEMLEWFYDQYYIEITVHDKFPRKILWEALRPYVKYYIIGKIFRSLEIQYRNYCLHKLAAYLKNFYYFNPEFGKLKYPLARLPKEGAGADADDEEDDDTNKEDLIFGSFYDEDSFNTRYIPFHMSRADC